MATEKQIRLGSLDRIMTSTFGSPVGQCQWAFSFSWAQLELQINKIIGERVGKGGKGGRRAKADAYFGCLG